MEICDKEQCSGCFACYNICSRKAIKMCEDDEIGHVYPIIDENLCVNCGACIKKCPNNNPQQLNLPQTVYAAWTLDETDHRSCASGGVATYLSKCILAKDGVVYGCSSYFKNKRIHHTRCETLEEVEDLKGSKYVQSDINDTYFQCLQDLKENRQVLFIGTPCQIAGLKSFLGKEYDNLITVDLVCHGVPSQKLLIEHLKRKIENPKTINFREHCSYTLRVQNEQKVYEKTQYDDLYFIGFCKQLFYRESCYQCKYATQKRVGDLTLGDFWGLKEINGDKKDKIKYGVSLLMVNTDYGIKFIEEVKDGLLLQERSLLEAIEGNPNLRQPAIPHKNKEKFKTLYPRKGFNRAMRVCLRKDIIKYKLLKRMKDNKFLMKIISKLR